MSRDELADDLDDRLVDANTRGAIAAVLVHYLHGAAKHTTAHDMADEVLTALLPDLTDALLPLIEAARATNDSTRRQRGDLMNTDWRGRNVRIFPGWDVLRRAPFVEGHVVSLRPAMWVVRDADGVEQEWPVTLPIEEA